MSSKRRRNFWDDETMEFNAGTSSPYESLADPYEAGEVAEDVEFLEDAHEAISKLFNKTNKRAKQMKGVRRKDAWQ